MSDKNRVLWSEGLFLRPQHFQQQERYFEHQIDSRVQAFAAYSYGLQSFDLDAEMLRHGKIAISSARGMLPDGTMFDIPSQTDAPEPLEIPNDCKEVVVALSLAYRRVDMPEMAYQKGKDGLLRYVGADQTVVNNLVEHASSVADIKVGRVELRLRLLNEVVTSHCLIGVIKVQERQVTGQVLLNDTYIPPVLDCRANQKLHGYLKDISGLLRHRATTLADRIAQPGHKGVSDFTDYLLLQVCNQFAPLLEHLHARFPLHPETFYQHLLQLLGALSTYGNKTRCPIKLDAYKHDNLQMTFEPIVNEIRRILTDLISEAAVAIPLIEKAKGLYVGEIRDPELAKHANFVLAINADIKQDQLRQTLPMHLKIGSVERIRDLVMSHLPGVRVNLLPIAPRQIPYQAGFSYFELSKEMEHWRYVEISLMLALHLAGDFPNVNIELWAIRANRA